MTRPRPAASTLRTLTAAVACAAALAACTSSGSPKNSASPGASGSGSTATSGAASTGTTGSSSASTQPGRSGHKPITTQTIQGSHLTYDIDIWARETTRTCTGQVTGAKLVALVRGKRCTMARSIGTTKVGGKTLGVALATVTFGGPAALAARSATQMAGLLTSSTSNGVVDLLHDGKHLPSGPDRVPDAAPGNAVNRAGTVTVVRAWYLTGTTGPNDPRLNEAVEDISST